VWFYRALWLSGIAADAPDRPALPQADTVRIVQDNERGSRAPDGESSGGLSNVIQVYSSCPTVELFVNGKSKGKQVCVAIRHTARPDPDPSQPCHTSVLESGQSYRFQLGDTTTQPLTRYVLCAQEVIRLPAVGATGGQWAEWTFPFTPGAKNGIFF
jgi:hypothetical protein